jgi:5-formyltetrahydrofolate cyclo-ligase
VFTKIQVFKPYQESKRIGIYLSMPAGEIQTDAIVRHALAHGKQVFVPYLYKLEKSSNNTPKSAMDMLELNSLSDYGTLKKDVWGIPSIDAETVEERESILKGGNAGLDMILMPGVAFDVDQTTGFVRRLGHGKGFYDYFLHRYRETWGSQVEKLSTVRGTDVLLYGLALEEQFLEAEKGTSVPVGEHDSPLHGLIMGNGKVLEGCTNTE